MKVVLIDWNSYGNEYMLALMKSRGYEVTLCPYDDKKAGKSRDIQIKEAAELIGAALPDYVFSYNYFPAISDICQEKGVRYISWIYDSPYMNLYSYTVVNPVNRIFVFDYGVYSEFERNNIATVFYLPLGVAGTLSGVREDGTLKNGALGEAVCGDAVSGKASGRFRSDISFVGSLYDESKHRLYEKFASMSPYAKGYLDAIIEAQKNIYGENILESLISEDIEAELQKAYPTDPNASTVMTPKQIYAGFVLSRQVTAKERSEILTLLGHTWGRGYGFNLFTNDKTKVIEGWTNRGPVDYYNEMPQVFAASKINLNITLRSILTGIPLRAFDIMGAGGFLLTNYQQEFGEYFVPGEDLVIYESYNDLLEKVEYYLSHEKERSEIALNGYNKAHKEHSIGSRLDEMEKYL